MPNRAFDHRSTDKMREFDRIRHPHVTSCALQTCVRRVAYFPHRQSHTIRTSMSQTIAHRHHSPLHSFSAHTFITFITSITSITCVKTSVSTRNHHACAQLCLFSRQKSSVSTRTCSDCAQIRSFAVRCLRPPADTDAFADASTDTSINASTDDRPIQITSPVPPHVVLG